MSTPLTVQELYRAGLVIGSGEPILTSKGRDWLRALEDISTDEVSDGVEASADLILSTSGLVR